MKRLPHIVMAIAAALTVFSCGERGKVIPRDDLADIYAEMFLADQWLRDNYAESKIADTSLVYAPILENHGYKAIDYVTSVNHYMEDPESFGKILEDVKDILQKRIDELTVEERRQSRLDSIRRAIEAMPFRRAEIFLGDGRDSVRKDTVWIVPDSTGLYEWRRILPDTVYYGPVFSVRGADTLSVADSVSVRDSLEKVAPAEPVKTDRKILSHPAGNKDESGKLNRKLLPPRINDDELVIDKKLKR
ncbi:MAG: DUF4296 domain-containing protein [Candidatus Cryptobacteroides sp.]